MHYALDAASWSLEFSQAALHVFAKNAQRGIFSKEAVGQLYSRDLTSSPVLVDAATLLKPSWARRAAVGFDTVQAKKERAQMFDKGSHCVGFWHTHPQQFPEPSEEDRRLARDHAEAARPQLAGIVFVIVGTADFPAGLRVWVDDGAQLRLARPA
jgi:hypothetical protein